MEPLCCSFKIQRGTPDTAFFANQRLRRGQRRRPRISSEDSKNDGPLHSTNDNGLEDGVSSGDYWVKGNFDPETRPQELFHENFAPTNRTKKNIADFWFLRPPRTLPSKLFV